jgi:tetratricopeptide (TPR) repeat protein
MSVHDCNWVEDHLDAWLDDELDDFDLARIEFEVERCERCAKELEASKKLRAALGRLPREIQPTRDLWPAIERQRRPRLRAWIPLAAAAGLAISLVGARALIPPPAAMPAEEAWRTEVETANTSFREALDASPNLDPAVRAVIEKNLADIDRAIGEIEKALEQNPSSAMLQKALVAMEQQRSDMLRQITLSSKAG